MSEGNAREELMAVLQDYSRRHKAVVLAIVYESDSEDVVFSASGCSTDDALEVLELTTREVREAPKPGPVTRTGFGKRGMRALRRG